MPGVVHFEIHADNPERAIQFYNGVFGWQAEKWDGVVDYWILTTGSEEEPGIDGAITRRRQPIQGNGATAFVCTINIPSIDECAARIVARGGAVISPKTVMPGIGWMAYAHDTEGNIFSFMQSDSRAR